jgi:mono/diheme cytochrome c family protein
MKLLVALVLAQAAVAQQQTERGEALFTDAKAGCAGCHALKGKGTAVGPDLSGIARLTPQAIAMAVHSTATQYVQMVKLKTDESFAAMPGPKDETAVQLWDLSKTPPELRKVTKADIASMNNTDGWKHPPAANKLSDQQLADIVAWIKYAVTGVKKEVTPDEVK